MTPLSEIVASIPSTICICGKQRCKVSFGKCHCGCGEDTMIAGWSRRSEYRIKGLPNRFLKGHDKRVWNKLPKPIPFKFRGRWCYYIPLTRRKKTLVYARFADVLMQRRWHALNSREGWYAVSKDVYMHRLLKQLAGDVLTFKDKIDHKNRNGLDNRLCNLRKSTNQQNTSNAHLSRANTSGYKGVSWNTRQKIYIVQIWLNCRPLFVGRTKDPAEGGRMYDKAARKYYGKFARLNFPRRGEAGVRD